MEISELLASINERVAKIQREGFNGENIRHKKSTGNTPHSGIYVLSPAGRKQISAAQKARWAKHRQEKENDIRARIADAVSLKSK